MNWKSAVVRGVRTLLQGVLATFLAFFLAVKGDGTFVNIKAHGSVLAFGLFISVCAAIVAFLQNVIEGWTNINVPKG